MRNFGLPMCVCECVYGSVCMRNSRACVRTVRAVMRLEKNRIVCDMRMGCI